jgi:hypothetical protein
MQLIASTLGWDLIRRNYLSPLPEVDHLPRGLWDGPRELRGLDLRVDEALAFLGQDLRGFIPEFRPPVHRTQDGPTGGYYLANASYESVDAEVLYSILRFAKPRQVVEFGSGASSHVIDFARQANARQGEPFTHEIFDPFPFSSSMGAVEGPVVHPVRAEDLDPLVVEKLKAGDVLFVDTTHTVKTGGDVVHIVLNMLPRVAPGVYVHFHDIFLPYEYPSEWVLERRYAWAEQYMLQAFLAFNPTYEVVFPAQAVARTAPELVQDVVPSYEDGVSPGAFWIRRR